MSEVQFDEEKSNYESYLPEEEKGKIESYVLKLGIAKNQSQVNIVLFVAIVVIIVISIVVYFNVGKSNRPDERDYLQKFPPGTSVIR